MHEQKKTPEISGGRSEKYFCLSDVIPEISGRNQKTSPGIIQEQKKQEILISSRNFWKQIRKIRNQNE